MSSVLYDEPGPRGRRRILIGSILGGLFVLAIIAVAISRLAANDIFDGNRWDIFTDEVMGFTPDVVWERLWVGARATLRAAAVSAVLALLLGVILAVLRMSRRAWIRVPATVVLELFRGLPVVLLMFFAAIGLGTSLFQAVVFGLTLYNGAIFAEILRAGIVALPKGQTEAAQAIGLTSGQTLRIVLLPQAVRSMLPSLVSQLVVLNKDTALGYIVAYPELLQAIQNLGEFYGSRYVFSLFFVGAALYIVVNFSLSRLAIWLERRLSGRTAGRPPKVTDLETELSADARNVPFGNP